MGWTGFPAAPEALVPFLGKQEGLTGPATPMELERLRFMGFGGASLVPSTPEPTGHSVLLGVPGSEGVNCMVRTGPEEFGLG